MASAASRMSVGKTCVYVSMVSAKEEWPSTSITTRGATPWASRKLAAVCRQS